MIKLETFRYSLNETRRRRIFIINIVIMLILITITLLSYEKLRTEILPIAGSVFLIWISNTHYFEQEVYFSIKNPGPRIQKLLQDRFLNDFAPLRYIFLQLYSTLHVIVTMLIIISSNILSIDIYDYILSYTLVTVLLPFAIYFVFLNLDRYFTYRDTKKNK